MTNKLGKDCTQAKPGIRSCPFFFKDKVKSSDWIKGQTRSPHFRLATTRKAGPLPYELVEEASEPIRKAMPGWNATHLLASLLRWSASGLALM